MKDERLDHSARGDILADIIIQCPFYFQVFTNCINQSIVGENFRVFLESANILPVYNSKDPFDKTNYSSVNILPPLSKIYERLIFYQSSRQTNNFLSKVFCGLRKAHSIQYAIFRLLQSWPRKLDNLEYVGVVAMHLSRGFNCYPSWFKYS